MLRGTEDVANTEACFESDSDWDTPGTIGSGDCVRIELPAAADIVDALGDAGGVTGSSDWLEALPPMGESEGARWE